MSTMECDLKPEQEFSVHIDHFVSVVENSNSTGLRAAIECSEILAKLYYLGFQLPSANQGGEIDIDAPELNEMEKQRIAEYSHRLPVSMYSESLDPLVLDAQEHSIGDLVYDICDIYMDIVGGNKLYKAGNVSAAIWHWNFHMRVHWGKHLTSALHILQCYIRSNMDYKA